MFKVRRRREANKTSYKGLSETEQNAVICTQNDQILYSKLVRQSLRCKCALKSKERPKKRKKGGLSTSFMATFWQFLVFRATSRILSNL